MSDKLIQQITAKTWLNTEVVSNIIKLLDEGNTVPFIARYRKELTQGATDVQLRDFDEIYTYTKNLNERKEDVLRLIAEKGLLTPELEAQIKACETLARLEDLYRPFKEKKNTKATIAIAKGLQPLADILATAWLTKELFEAKASEFIKDTGDKKTSVKDIEEAIQGAKDIIAEQVSDDPTLRDFIKKNEEKFWVIQTKPTKTFEENGVYKIYKEYRKPINQIPSYAYLALARAEKEKQLSLNFEMNKERIELKAQEIFVPSQAQSSKIYLIEALLDGLKRLLYPSIEREIRSNKKEESDIQAIKVFGENMAQLLLGSPVKGKTILALDPGFRTGCKVAIVDPTGKFLDHAVIYPTDGEKKNVPASEKLLMHLLDTYKVDLIVIGNGTASRETEQFVSQLLKSHNSQVKYLIASEAGASVYSASELAQKEYPDLDVTVRGAISIAHRVQDPLAELIKIDPKSIGVGQYQHDVDQKLLKEMLDKKIEDTVNKVGVDVNTASVALLTYVAGLSNKTAQGIIEYRDTNGIFMDRKHIKKAKGVWPKAFEQAIGFLRVKESKEPLDHTGIHPETYDVTYTILEKEFSIKKKDVKLPLKLELKNILELSKKYEIWTDTLSDIFKELAHPGLDPRSEFDTQLFRSDILDIKELTEGMVLTGVVRNIVDFGVFVDVGLHSDGLIHKSQLSDTYIENPMDVVSVGQAISATVIAIDIEKEKISLSLKKDPKAASIRKPQQTFQYNPQKTFTPTSPNKSSSWTVEIKSNITFK